jgi:hypothetical protein
MKMKSPKKAIRVILKKPYCVYKSRYHLPGSKSFARARRFPSFLLFTTNEL